MLKEKGLTAKLQVEATLDDQQVLYMRVYDPTASARSEGLEGLYSPLK